MTTIARLLAGNRAHSATYAAIADRRPAQRVAIVTCMDARIDVLSALGLHLGDAHVVRNAGGRVTDDVLRSLAVSCHAFGVQTAVVMHHTGCGLTDVPDGELRRLTGADVHFFAIGDHRAALREDVATLTTTPFLGPLQVVAGFLYDVGSGELQDVVRWQRQPAG
jgi:carbonic anhydrase